MDSQIANLTAVRTALQKSPDTPWYLVALVQSTLDLVQEFVNLQALSAVQAEKLQEQHKALQTLKNQYSEVLYHLKTADK